MYIHQYKGQFLILHDPKNTLEDRDRSVTCVNDIIDR